MIMWELLLFYTELISTEFIWGNVFPRRELQIDGQKPSNLNNFESVISIKSGSMPLSKFETFSLSWFHSYEM